MTQASHLYDKPWYGNTSVDLDECEKGTSLRAIQVHFYSTEDVMILLEEAMNRRDYLTLNPRQVTCDDLEYM